MTTHAHRIVRRLLPALVLAALAAATLPVPAAGATDPARVERLRDGMDQAKKDGAKGQLPQAWWDLDARLDAAAKSGATEEQWRALEADVAHLRSAAAFVSRMRQQKSGIEAVLSRFDQALAEIGALYGVDPDPTLSGSPAARDLLDRLGESRLEARILVDSLTVENRRLNEMVGTRIVEQDSLITALRVEVSALRQKLWDTELRAGVAEADRTAAESVLTRKQQREQAIAEVRGAFGPDEAEIMLTAEGDVVLRLFGVAFGVGSATMSPGQEGLVTRVADAARRFPGAAVRVEGHTDDTGGRDANLRLSRRRAESVARLLENELGWEGETIATEGFGPDRPIALNSTAEGRARNRRIDVVIAGGL
ncbi:OmpA family protein [bacterium]|nr:OmpA family protein [bacterium]